MPSLGSLLAVVIVAVVAAAAGLIWLLTARRQRVVLGEHALLDRSLGVGWIPLDEIEGAYLPRQARQARQARHARGARGDDLSCVVHLQVRVTPRLLRTLPRCRTAGQIAAESSRSVELIVDLTDTGVSPVELLQAIVRGNNASHPTSAQREAAS